MQSGRFAWKLENGLAIVEPVHSSFFTMTAGFISTVMANHLPGPGTIYISQTVHFLAPVRIGDTVTAVAEVAELHPDKNKVRMKTYCLNQDGTKVLDGEAIVSPPKAPQKKQKEVR